MKHLSAFIILFLITVTSFCQAEEYYGAFPGWTNLKKKYGAAGDGKTDDTKAIQKALDELGEIGYSPVLFIPNGVYLITSTLTMKTKKGIAIYGEDPLKTIIKWDGAAGERMFFLNGVSYSEYGRITWDGSNKAAVAYAHEWDTKVRYANSGSQHMDEVFKDVGVGIKSGNNMDAEMSIRRCRFYNCFTVGVSLQGPNALDWWLWDCYFEKCAVGVANNTPIFGAGNYHVYRCIFNRTTRSDIALGNSNFFSFRNNISYNPGYFIRASQFSNTSPITIQNNIVISDSNKVLVELFTKGNVLITGNTFITPEAGNNFVIRNVNMYKGTKPDITLINNSFTTKTKQVEYGGGKVVESGTVKGMARGKLPPIKPYDFATKVNYPVFEVTDTIKTAALQSLIGKLSLLKQKVIIHFSAGNYNLTAPISIPGNAALILTGDGLRSVLSYNQPADSLNDAVVKIASPAKCILRSLWIQGNRKTDGVLVNDDDQAGNLVYGNQLMLFNGIKSNLYVNGFANTGFRFENFQHNYSKGISVNVVGTGSNNNAFIKILGGESAANENSYSVDKGAKVLVFDTWYEGGGKQFMSLEGKGEFYLNGAKIAVSGGTADPFIGVDNFEGKVVIAQAIYNSPKKKIYFNNNSGKASLLITGTLSWTDSTNAFNVMQDRQKKYALINNRYNVGVGSIQLPDDGNNNPEFLTTMLGPILSTSMAPENKPGKKQTQLIFERVMIDGARNNLKIIKNGVKG